MTGGCFVGAPYSGGILFTGLVTGINYAAGFADSYTATA